MRSLRGKRVLLGVGGGIAAYKSAEVIRRLIAAGADVQVAMTLAATRFITPLTLQTLSRRPVASDLLSESEDAAIGHIRLAEEADVVLVAPATADLVARLAAGIADDMVTATALVTRAPIVVAPSMNTLMLEHPATQANLATLRGYGYRIVDPASGELACGYEGAGRLPDPEDLVQEVAAALSSPELRGRRVVVSAGPTCEPIDPVRHVTNRSSGRMGYAVAAAAWRRGAAVTLVSGPTSLPIPRGVEAVHVRTAAEMATSMTAQSANADVVVMVAAVADYRPMNAAAAKIKKTEGELQLQLERTEDVLASLSRTKGRRILVGFAAETDAVRENALSKLRRKNLDLIVANDVSAPGTGFDVSTNAAILIDAAGGEKHSGLVGKDDLAEMILDEVARILRATLSPSQSN
ncbi:MAG TPA: bifunctional phosphopantothenoylcysteine decarboxylase/phosphopantothenate--cysteine ligase CoaBC [Candidatus Binatia bacterium]|nr:bifunctional phosphopantothenoylcysteine decarboxylase/phosphopantothenate--cysteine ligase CoaBC [Candidatus Binatia bacterium]